MKKILKSKWNQKINKFNNCKYLKFIDIKM